MSKLGNDRRLSYKAFESLSKTTKPPVLSNKNLKIDWQKIDLHTASTATKTIFGLKPSKTEIFLNVLDYITGEIEKTINDAAGKIAKNSLSKFVAQGNYVDLNVFTILAREVQECAEACNNSWEEFEGIKLIFNGECEDW